MKMEAMKVLLIDDKDLVSDNMGILDTFYGARISDHLVREADLIIHISTGKIYKSRWTVVPKDPIRNEDLV